VFVDVILVSAVLYIINFANCYQNGPKKLERKEEEGKESNHNLFGEYTKKIIGVSGKLHTLHNPFLL
jgi:hypothetical protein